jgi:hypothetical protein
MKTITGTAQTSSYGVEILLGLNRLGKHIYEGTVPSAEKASRRAKNKAARKARKAASR